MSAFLMNCWYMAGWSHELPAGSTLARRLVDLPVVLYRMSNGTPAALFDRCPHRFAPLSRGKIMGDDLRCGYHGLTFNSKGACVHNYFAGVTPANAKARAFPVLERDHILWFWPGDAQSADPALIPSFPSHEDPNYDFIWGKSEVPAHFELVTDNLMDLSHVTFLHPGFGGELFRPTLRMERDEETIRAHFFTKDAPCSPFGELSFPAGGKNVDEHDIMRWNAPASMLLDVYRNHTGKPPQEGGHNPSAHILTPQTATRTHYFWGSGMPAKLKVDRELHRQFLTQAFETEDKPMLGAVHDAMAGGDFWDMHPAILSVDQASVMVRRLLRKRLRQEQGLANDGNEVAEVVA